jgi:hypothetical protein
MTLTRIYFRRYSRLFVFGAGLLLASLVSYRLMAAQNEKHLQQVESLLGQSVAVTQETGQTDIEQGPSSDPLWQRQLTVTGYFAGPDRVVYFLVDVDGNAIRSTYLEDRGFRIVQRGPCEVLWIDPFDPRRKGTAYCGLTNIAKSDDA